MKRVNILLVVIAVLLLIARTVCLADALSTEVINNLFDFDELKIEVTKRGNKETNKDGDVSNNDGNNSSSGNERKGKHPGSALLADSINLHLESKELKLKTTLQLTKMQHIFKHDAVIRVEVDSDDQQGKTVMKNIPLSEITSKSSSYWMKPSNGNGEWAIITLQSDPDDPSQITVHGEFTMSNGLKIFQIDHINKHKDTMKTDDYEQLKKSSKTGYTIHEVRHDNINLKNDKDSQVLSQSKCGSHADGKLTEEKINLRAKENVVTSSPTGTSGAASYIQFFPNCYQNDFLTHEFDVSLAVDLGYYKAAGASTAKVTAEVESMMSSTRLVYLMQLNVLLSVKMLQITTTSNARSPLDMSRQDRTCMNDISAALDKFASWNYANNYGVSARESGHWTILSDCWPAPGVVGIAYVSSLCRSNVNVAVVSRISSTSTWLIYAHELGHGFGALHSFENGMGRTGGIMDYGNPYYKGLIQFHEYKRPEICPVLNSIVRLGCKHIRSIGSDSGCGNGILGTTEDCECLTLGQTSCGACVNCKLQNINIKCSTANFLMRTSASDFATDYIEVKADKLSDSQCCSPTGELRSAPTTCNNGNDVCVSGKCTQFCTKYSLLSCPLINDGCKQPCKDRTGDDVCYADLVDSNTGLRVGWMPDGVYCDNGAGKCQRGNCISLTPTLPKPTVHPTKKPTARPTTRAPSKTPTPKPTGRPDTPYPTTSRPTKYPTNKPTTKSPTMYPTRVGQTLRPTTTAPTTAAPVPTSRPSRNPTRFRPTRSPTTPKPTVKPTTAKPTTVPTTKSPTTAKPTKVPTTKRPTTVPTTKSPTTPKPTVKPTTKKPSTVPTTKQPTTKKPT